MSASKWVKRRYTRLLRSSRSRSRKLQPFRCFITQQRRRRSGAMPVRPVRVERGLRLARHWRTKSIKAGSSRSWPAASTVGQILSRAGLTNPRRKKRRATPSSQPFSMVTAPNQLWCMDFKGYFLTGDGYRCDPFTITDAHSRFLIRCQAVARMDLAQVSAVCDAAMREFGMPERIRTDNGAPFAGVGLLGLSKLSLGWMKLGIIHERIQPGRPQQNGRHERMHRTLKEDTAKPPAGTLIAQQKKFDRFRATFNHERPHEALGNETPGSIYVPSARMFPSSVASFQYPKSFLTRRVNNSGDISWHKNRVFISEVFRNEEIGLERMDEDVHRVFFHTTELGEFNSADMRFRAALRT